MTLDEAITAEVGRYVTAVRNNDQHLAHIRFAALRRLRGLAPYDSARLDEDAAGDAMFGDDHLHPAIDLPLAA